MENVFLNGDCRTLVHDLADESVDLILTDPPYIGIVKDKWDQTEMIIHLPTL